VNKKVVVVDGIELEVDDFSTDLVTYSPEQVRRYISEGKPNVKMTIRFEDMKFIAPIEGMEFIADRVYVYGPFRNMFPALFKDKLLLDWQIAYVNSRLPFDPLDVYRRWRHDPLFMSEHAKAFRDGYQIGYEKGRLNE